MKKNKVIYSLTVEDIQMVANQEIERDLLPEEMEKIIELVAERMDWYDTISDSIHQIM